jgi:hypothetical protein
MPFFLHLAFNPTRRVCVLPHGHRTMEAELWGIWGLSAGCKMNKLRVISVINWFKSPFSAP